MDLIKSFASHRRKEGEVLWMASVVKRRFDGNLLEYTGLDKDSDLTRPPKESVLAISSSASGGIVSSIIGVSRMMICSRNWEIF